MLLYYGHWRRRILPAHNEAGVQLTATELGRMRRLYVPLAIVFSAVQSKRLVVVVLMISGRVRVVG